MPNCKPDIRIIWGDDTGISNLSCCTGGLMGHRRPNIDRVAAEGFRFTNWHATFRRPTIWHRERRRRHDAAGVGRRSDRRRTQACHAAPIAGRFSCGIARR